MKPRLHDVREYVKKHDNIVDLGIGKGYYYSKIEPKNVIGVDLNTKSLGKLGRNYPWIKQVVADVSNTGLPDNSCDFVIMSQVIEHIEDYIMVLREAKRICRKGGYFYIAVPMDLKHKLHFHPIWTPHIMLTVASYLGEFISLRRIEGENPVWALYVKK